MTQPPLEHGNTMIRAVGVTKSFGHGASCVHALRGADLEISRGGFVSIMGPSGSGKSTLLNLLSALDVPTSGRIEIDGRDISRLDDEALTVFRRRHTGLVFQSFNLMPTLNALDNTLLPLMLERKVNRLDRERARELLSDVGLGHRITHRIDQLSGGEMQRVAIARALILRSKLLLADEPTGNLDSTTGTQILRLLRAMCDQHKVTIAMVTHDQNAARVGDRTITLRDGVIVD